MTANKEFHIEMVDKIEEISCPECGSNDWLDWIFDNQELPCKCEDNPHLYDARFSCECGSEFTAVRDDRY